jgi:predicted thioredoxin/glutaredoxin
MIKLRIALQAFLLTKHARVYFQTAPDKAVYPYIVFDIPNMLPDGEYQEQVIVDIDGWDSPVNGDTTVLETLMTTINSLNKTILTAENMRAVFFLENKIPLIDPDPRIKRRKYTYQVKLFKGE